MYISFRLELITLGGGVIHQDPSSPFVSLSSIFFLQSERLQVLLYHVSPSLLLPCRPTHILRPTHKYTHTHILRPTHKYTYTHI